MPPASTLTPVRTVLLAGATGLVGREVLRLALRDPGVQEVRVPLRREVNLIALLQCQAADGTPLTEAEQGKLQPWRVDFDRLARHADGFAVDAVVCALGTTIRQAGSRAAFRKVDFEAPLQIAQLAHAQGASRFALVSALGASARSRVFYSRVKGELEDAIARVGFVQFTVAQPSLLEGDRSEHRFGEQLGLKLAGWFSAVVPSSHLPVHVRQVAQGLWEAAQSPTPAPRMVLGNADLRRMR
jgi:uncharacterized protein YbjT (DUF2867 family)